MRANILTIPSELRLQVYSYLHAPVFDLDLCKGLLEARVDKCTSKQQRSPILTYLQRRRVSMQWARERGIHLLATNGILAREYSELLDRSILRFHCYKCLMKLLTHLCSDLELKQPVLKNISTRVDVSNIARRIDTWASSYVRLEHSFSTFRSIVCQFYGAFETIYDEFDQTLVQGLDRKWLVEKVMITGKLPKRLGMHNGNQVEDTGNPTSSYEDDISEAEIDEPQEEDIADNYWHRYASIEGVEELRRSKQQWNISDSGTDPLRKVKQKIEGYIFSSCDDAWRTLQRDPTSNRKKRNLVCREEIWIGLSLP